MNMKVRPGYFQGEVEKTPEWAEFTKHFPYQPLNLNLDMRFAIIDMDNLKFLGVTDSLQKACLIDYVEHQDVATRIVSLSLRSNWSVFDRMSMTMLYKNEIGGDLPIHDYAGMCNAIHDAAWNVILDQRSLLALTTAADGMPEDVQATETGFQPVIRRASPDQQYPARQVGATSSGAPKVERAPREPSSAPSPKGATGRVWLIADRVHQENGGGAIDKVLRTKIIEACVAEGINAATAGTQYSKWKATK